MASFSVGDRQPRAEPTPESIIGDINREFGFYIPLEVDNRKLRPDELSDGERCYLRIRPLMSAWGNVTAVYQCVEDVRKLREMNPYFTRSQLVNSLATFLKHRLEQVKTAGLGSNAVQSFGPTVPLPSSQRAPQKRTANVAQYFDGGDDPYTSDTEVGASDDGTADLLAPEITKRDKFAAQGPREHWQSHRFPQGGLFVSSMDNCPSLLQAPFAVRYECTRLATAYGLDLEEVDDFYAQLPKQQKRPKLQRVGSGPSRNVSPWEDLSLLHKHLNSLATSPQPPAASSDVAWRAALADSDHVCLSAKLAFETNTKNTTGLFRLHLSPLSTQPHSKRLFRKFNASRFLAVKIPDFKNAPKHVKPRDDLLRMRLQEWLGTSDGKSFAGNQWSFVHLGPVKSDKRQKTKGASVYAYEALFFATSGPGLEPISIKNLVSWFMPLERNLSSTFAKAYARLELGLSKTYATIQFTPGQIHYIDDKYGDDTPEDSRFNDRRFDCINAYDPEHPKVMNDGCSRISYAAATEAWQRMTHTPGLDVPSAFQARIGPAKGVWVVEARDHIDNSTYGPVWIEITKSQKKFEPHEEDLSLTNKHHDPHRLTFEIVAWSQHRPSSKLYTSFCPIMEDRGVSRDVLAARVMESLKQEQLTIEAALDNKEQLVRWLQSLEGAMVTRGSDAWPFKRADQIRKMVYAGFDPKHSKYLADLCSKVILGRLSQLCVTLHAESQCSAYLLGVADPYHCLAPGEVHVYFSSSVTLPGGRKGTVLNNVEALVARHPALRPSDLQKIRIVFRPELAHLTDVAVFPTRGSIPLASKLQGGDYDGDTFWLCWEPDVVKDFRNKPAPLSDPDAAALGIQQDRRTLGEVLEEGGVNRFLVEGVSLQLREQLLGQVTSIHTRVTYAQNKLESDGINALTDLHDLLVDHSKNGYIFEQQDLGRFLDRFPNMKARELTDPAWKTAAANLSEEICDDKSPLPDYNTDNIIDHLVFDVAVPQGRKIHQHIYDKMQATIEEEDEDLARPFRSALESESTPMLLKQVLANLAKDIGSIFTNRWHYSWCFEAESDTERSRRYRSEFSKLRTAFHDLQPRHGGTGQSVDEFRYALTTRTSHASPSAWDQLKASCVWCSRRGKSARPVLEICGELLCYIKSHSGTSTSTINGGLQGVMPVYIVPSMMNGMKMRRVRQGVSVHSLDLDEESEGDGEEADAEEQMEAGDVGMADANAPMPSAEGQQEWAAHEEALDPEPEGMRYNGAGDGREVVQGPSYTDRLSANVVDELSQMFGSSMSRFSA